MSRSSKKQLSELEILQQENKELRSVNKSLMRKLKDESKKYKPQQSSHSLIKEEYENKDSCLNCGKGRITTTDIGVRKIIGCTLNCGFRKIIKNVKKEEEI